MFTTRRTTVPALVFALLALMVLVAPGFADDAEPVAPQVEVDHPAEAAPAGGAEAPAVDLDAAKGPQLEQDDQINPAGSCGSYIYSQPCQTGGWYTVFCEACPGKQCYHRWEGTRYNYSGGIRSSGFQMTTRCSVPPSMATCNTTCTL